MLEQLRLLTNLETAKQKLLQIILIAQPELREILARDDLRQLAQRASSYRCRPLPSAEETVQSSPVDEAVDGIRNRFGKSSVNRARTLDPGQIR